MKKINFLIIVFAAAISLSSCDKALDLQPSDAFTESNAFTKLSDLQQGANAAYANYGTYADDMFVSALLSDEAKLGRDNSGQGALTYRFQYSSDLTTGGDVVAAFGGYYSVIDQTNRVLAAFSKVNVLPQDEVRKSVLKGQLLALRAIAHFGLLQAYCGNYNPTALGVPLMLASNPTGKPARNTMGEVMNQIDEDLTTAKVLVAGEAFTDTVMNKFNIAAYQARIALYQATFDPAKYDEAALLATEVISSGVQSLASRTEFPNIWTDASAKETLFRIRYATSSAIGSIWTTTGSNIYIAPSDKLSAAYNNNDVRLGAYIGTDPTTGDRYVNKFYTSGRGGRIVDLKACRISEMYLIRAEANARKASPDLTAAASDLNLLRGYRISGYIDQSFANQTDLINAVMLERYKELCFEGFRFFDLKRNGLSVDRLASDASSAWQTLPAGDYRFVMPIPRSELNVNPNMVQNPGYN